MTLQQLQYAVTVASAGTITEAAERLYITQPSLTTAIRELEKEMNLTIFIRSNRGVVVSRGLSWIRKADIGADRAAQRKVHE